jgi:hypothetical protein
MSNLKISLHLVGRETIRLMVQKVESMKLLESLYKHYLPHLLFPSLSTSIFPGSKFFTLFEILYLYMHRLKASELYILLRYFCFRVIYYILKRSKALSSHKGAREIYNLNRHKRLCLWKFKANSSKRTITTINSLLTSAKKKKTERHNRSSTPITTHSIAP